MTDFEAFQASLEKAKAYKTWVLLVEFDGQPHFIENLTFAECQKKAEVWIAMDAKVSIALMTHNIKTK